jgi:putative membrane protein
MVLADKLAALNAILNGSSALCVLTGWWLIRKGHREHHRNLMLAAVGISAAFLVSYLARVALSGTHPYPKDAPFRGLYLVILSSHVLLAILVPPMAVRAVWLAIKGRFEEHKRLVKWAAPVWLYVSATGVLVYLMLYHLADVV